MENFNFDLNLNMDTILEEINKQKGAARFLKFAEGDTVVRLLPPTEGNNVPWAFTYNHFAQMPTGNWEAINCPQTHKGMCAICNKIAELYNTKNEENIKIARKIKKNKKYYYNVLLISSPHSEFSQLVGNVFVMQVGPKINDIIQRDLKDKDIGLALFNPIDGFDFIINSTKNSMGLPNYDLSKTGRKKYSVADSREKLEQIMADRVDLSQFVTQTTLQDTRKWLNNYFANIDDMSENLNTDNSNSDITVLNQAISSHTEEVHTEESSIENKQNDITSTIDNYLQDLN